MISVTWQNLRRRRFTRNFLASPADPSRLTEVVNAVGGIQAQVLSAAELAIGARVDGVTKQDVQDELWEQRRLVKTYGARQTLHLLPASELSLWMAAMRQRENLQEKPWYAQAGLDASQGEAIIQAIGRALDGARLKRDELAEAVAKQVGNWAHELMVSTWGELLPPAARLGYLCFGPNAGNKVTFVRADQWVDGWEERAPELSLLEILRRYISTYGPATPQDFARWFWIKPAISETLFQSLAPELTEVSLEGQPAWILSTDADDLENQLPPPGLKLVPQYDCYVLGSNPRQQIVPEAARRRISSYGRGRFEGATGLPLLLQDGLVAGIWQRKSRSRQTEVRLEPFVELDKAQREVLDGEIERLESFLNSKINLSIGALT